MSSDNDNTSYRNIEMSKCSSEIKCNINRHTEDMTIHKTDCTTTAVQIGLLPAQAWLLIRCIILFFNGVKCP